MRRTCSHRMSLLEASRASSNETGQRVRAEGYQHLDHLRARHLRPNYVESRERVINRLEHHLGDDPLAATLTDLRCYLDRGLAPGSLATEIAHLKGFYKWALLEGHISSDPTLRLERPKVPPGQPRPIATRDLAAALTVSGGLIRPMLYLAAYAGLRACEIAPLRGEHILLDDDPPLLVVVEGKGGVPGSVPINPILGTVVATLPRHGWCFPRIDGKAGHLSRYRICQLCNGLLHGLGINATLHQLRHWYGTELYRATLDLRVTQKLMRHSSSKTTDRYTYVADSAGVEAVAALPEVA